MAKKVISLLKTSLTVPILYWGLSMLANILNWLFNLQAGRTLSSNEFATLTVFLSFQYLLSIPTQALTTTVSRYTAYYTEKGEKDKQFYFFRQYWWLSWGVGLITLSLFIIFQQFISHFFHIESSSYIVLFSLIFIPTFLLSFEVGNLLGMLAFLWVGVLAFLLSLFKFGFLFFSSPLHLSPLTITIFALPISVIITWVISLLITRSYHPTSSGKIQNSRNHLSETYRFLGNAVFATLGIVLIYNIDVLLVKHFFTSYEAGIYSTLSLLGKTLYFGAGSVIGLLIPLTAKEQAQGKSGRRALLILLSIIALVGTFILLVYITFPQFIVTFLLTSKALPVLPYLTTYSLGMLFLVLVTCFITYSLAKKEYLPARITVFAALVQAVLIFFHHDSLQQIVTIVTSTLFCLLLILTMSEFFGLNYQSVRINISSLLKLIFNTHPSSVNDNQQVRILIFNWRDIKHVFSGGSEVYLHEIGQRLNKKGFDITLFTSNDGECSSFESIDGIKVIRRGGFVTVYIWAMIYYLFRLRGKNDIIIDVENGIPFFSPLYCRKPVILLIHHVHKNIFFKSLFPPFSWIAQFLESIVMPIVYKRSKIVTVSRSTADELQEEIGLTASHIISNGVDINRYKGTDKSSYPLISYVGRLKKYKSIDILLQAFKKLSDEVPDARLVIVGEGDQRAVLEQESYKLGITPLVSFFGHVSDDEKIDVLGTSWVMVQPSYMEGWGITCLEANACQTPVIASRVAGLKDSVSIGVSGLLFEYGNVDELYQLLKTILIDNNKRFYMSQSARLWSEQYSWDQQANKYELLIQQILRINLDASSLFVNDYMLQHHAINFSKKRILPDEIS